MVAKRKLKPKDRLPRQYEVECPCGLLKFLDESDALYQHLAVCPSVAYGVQAWVRKHCDERGIKWRDTNSGAPANETFWHRQGLPRAIPKEEG